MASLAPSRSQVLSDIQQTMASMSWPTWGWFLRRAIMSPRAMSISSARRTVTDIGAKASSTGPSAVSMRGDGGGEARRQHDDLVARLEHAAGHLPA